MIVVRTLGTAEIQVGETRILPTAPRKFALLLYLAAERGRPIPRATLQDLIFPDQTEKNGRHSLRELVYQLRRLGAHIKADAQGIQFEDHVTDDLNELLAAEALTATHIRQLEGGFLPGYGPDYSESLSEWLEGFRARSTFQLCKMLVVEIRRSRSVGDWPQAEHASRACLAIDGLNETATMTLAEALTLGGAKAQAVGLLERYIGEVGDRARDLRVAPSVLRRRIGERTNEYHQTTTSSSPFVGRDAEMRILHAHLRHAIEGESQCVAVVGEAGIGKTRLIAEFCQIVALDGIRVASTASQPHDVHRPFGAFADLFHELIAMPGALGISPDSMNLLQRLVRRPTPDDTAFASAVRESDSFFHAITHAIIDLVDSITSENTLVLTVEDISALDSMSLRLFGYMLSGSRRRRLCVLVSSRDASAARILSANHRTTIELNGVDPVSAARLVETVCARAHVDIDHDMVNWLRDASGGHPLFLENLLAHYSNTRERFAISPSLSSLLCQRIDVLSDPASATLQTCAVLGKFATLDTITSATQLARFDLVRAVGELESRRLIRSDAEQVRPFHALVSDVVLQRMTPLERRLSHQCAALALEAGLDIEHSAALLWECAEHWCKAGNTNRAIAAVQRCADHALGVGRPGAAAQMLARALSLSSSPGDQVLIARRLVATADAARDPNLALTGIECLRKNHQVESDDDLGLAEFRARTRLLYDGLGREAELLKFVSDERASSDHRVAAATLLLKYADSTFDREPANRAMSALPAAVIEAASEFTRLEYLMLAHSQRKQYDAAAAVAREFDRSIDGAPPAIGLRLSINPAIALFNAGFADESAQIAERRYRQAEDTGDPHIMLTLAVFLTEHFSDAFDDRRSVFWQQKIDGIVDAYPTLAHDFSHWISRLNISLANNDLPTARATFDAMDRAKMLEGGPIRARWRRVGLIRLAQLEGDALIEEPELEALIAAAKEAAVIGGVCDTEAAAACHEIVRRGAPVEAFRFYNAYVHDFRHSRAPIARCLIMAFKAIELACAARANPDEGSGAAHGLRISDSYDLRRRRDNNSQRRDIPLVTCGREERGPQRTRKESVGDLGIELR